MRLHRFYVTEIELKHDFWLHDQRLIKQWSRVLRFVAGQEVILFNQTHERLYRISELTDREAHLRHVTDMKRTLPKREIYLFFSLLKRDKNDWVLQKCTELGVSHFVPLLAERSISTGFNIERSEKIVIEAAEQCGRSDIPTVREPMRIATVLQEFSGKMPLFICEQGTDEPNITVNQAGVFIGPEGGWSDAERNLFESHAVVHMRLHDFTLRAETACITATHLLLK